MPNIGHQIIEETVLSQATEILFLGLVLTPPTAPFTAHSPVPTAAPTFESTSSFLHYGLNTTHCNPYCTITYLF